MKLTGEVLMPKTASSARFRPASTVSDRLAIWNRRLLIAAATFILWSATALALQAAGAFQSAMLVGEGMSIVAPDE